MKRFALVVVMLLMSSWVAGTTAEAAPSFASTAFQNLWEYSDKAVEEIPGVGRGYTWGPNAFAATVENYKEAPNGKRTVQYFDKSRMELVKDGSVTNGLLTKELVTGMRQDGDKTFTKQEPSGIPVAGDDAGNVGPTYASFKDVISTVPGQNSAPNAVGQPAALTIDATGKVGTLEGLPAALNIGYYDSVFGHNVPQAFADFQKLNGQVWNANTRRYGSQKVYTDNPTANVFGLAISEPYWVRATVGGEVKDVLVQLFERRVLTYTPSNPDAFKVEMGNIGQHYFNWRYAKTAPAALPPVQPATCTESVPAATPNLSINVKLQNPTAAAGKQVLCVAANKAGQPAVKAKIAIVFTTRSSKRDIVGDDTDATGLSNSDWLLGNLTKGYAVKVDVTVTYNGETATTSTSWTPQ